MVAIFLYIEMRYFQKERFDKYLNLCYSIYKVSARFQLLNLGSNAWNSSTDGLFCWNSNNAVGNSNANYGALATGGCKSLLHLVLTCID